MMVEWTIEAPARPAVPVAGTDARFPAGRIFCVGQNYAAHAREMGADPDREAPFFFTKQLTGLVLNGNDVPYPPLTNDLHHEVELVVAIGTGGRDIAVRQALGHVYGYGVGVDLTRRDLQRVAKQSGRPWDLAKGFDGAAPLSALKAVADIGHPGTTAITLEVNGEVRQDGALDQMIWKVPEVIATLSTYGALHAGDLIFTGTPAGVGPLARGDRVRASVTGVADLTFGVV